MKKIRRGLTKVRWILTGILSVFIAACGGAGQGPILGAGSLSPITSPVVVVPPVVTPPAVSLVTPFPNMTGVSVNTNTITAVFNKPMDASTLSPGSFTLACPAATAFSGTSVTYVTGSQSATLTLPFGMMLPANTVCVATVTTAAKDSTGLAVASNFAWPFTTSALADTTAPTVIGTINANGASNVATNTKVGATFSEAMSPLTLTNSSFTLKQTLGNIAVSGLTSYSGVNAVFAPTSALAANTNYTATITTAATDLAGNPMISNYNWSWTTAAMADTSAPLVTLANPADLSINVPVSSSINATFNEAMDPQTIGTANFSVAGATGVVTFNALDKIATFTPTSSLTAATTYTATVTSGVTDLAGNHLAANKTWAFTTAAVPVVVPVLLPGVDLITAAPFGTFGGTAGMTNTGTLTILNGDIGTIATGTSMVTGFHDTLGDIYTETPANIGAVNGKLYTCTNSVTGPTSTGPNAVSCAIATQARLDAQTAYLALVARPAGGASPAPGANLAGVTVLPGTYVAPGGSFMIQGGNLTLDAQGNANAVWVFQMASTLTVGGPGAAFPQSIILAGGALAKNVFWQVGSFATVNAAGGGTMVGTIIAQSGASFSTVGNTNIVTLNGRVLSLGASVTMVNTVINVPAP
jgi:hypothetical protein